MTVHEYVHPSGVHNNERAAIIAQVYATALERLDQRTFWARVACDDFVRMINGKAINED